MQFHSWAQEKEASGKKCSQWNPNFATRPFSRFTPRVLGGMNFRSRFELGSVSYQPNFDSRGAENLGKEGKNSLPAFFRCIFLFTRKVFPWNVTTKLGTGSARRFERAFSPESRRSFNSRVVISPQKWCKISLSWFGHSFTAFEAFLRASPFLSAA